MTMNKTKNYNKTISFLIPVYNEEKRLKKTFTALATGFKIRGLTLEKVIFVDDGSTDKTASVVAKNKTKLQKALKADVQLVSYKLNKGKGCAIKTGMTHSDSDYTLFFDADMSTPLSELSKFVPQIKGGTAVIIGTRKNGGSTVIVHQPLYRELMGKCFTLLSNLILNTHVNDFTCGFKAFSRRAKNGIFSRSLVDGWGFDAEILFLANRLGYKVQEVPVVWSNDKNTRVHLIRAVLNSFDELLQIRGNQVFGKYALVEKISPRPLFPLIKSKFVKWA